MSSTYQSITLQVTLQNAICVSWADISEHTATTIKAWGKYVSDIELIMNSLSHESTGFTPYEIMLGMRPKSVVEELINFPPRQELNLARKKEMLKDQMNKRAQARIKRHDENLKPMKFKIHDKVLVKMHEKSSEIDNEIAKFKFIYNGPFEIQSIPHPNAYYLVYPQSGKKFGVQNISDLQPYQSRDN